MLTKTAENYLKQIWLAEQRGAAPVVSMGEVASEMSVTPGTATTMVKSLADANLLRYEPRQGVRLTKKGRLAAANVIRRHRLIEAFLVQVVGMPWSEVHEEAEELEHSVSERLLGYIDALLGSPTADPHGDPIPDSEGKIVAFAHRSLADLDEGAEATVARLLDQSADFLGYARAKGLVPGRKFRIKKRDSVIGVVSFRLDAGATLSLSLPAAEKVLVT